MSDTALDAIRTLFEAGDGRDVAHMLHDHVELRPPTYGKAWRGRFLVGRLLRFASLSLRDMRYNGVWSGADQHVLRFDGWVADEPISGVDLVRIDSQGLITEIEIFARPPRAVLKLRDRMGVHVRGDVEVAAAMEMSASGAAD